ncbi:hypothetical protein WDZ92_39050, partial [Nostoc sp. NIES-2111]
ELGDDLVCRVDGLGHDPVRVSARPVSTPPLIGPSSAPFKLFRTSLRRVEAALRFAGFVKLPL